MRKTIRFLPRAQAPAAQHGQGKPFEDVTAAAGPLSSPRVSRSAVFGDVNNDGGIDILSQTTTAHAPAAQYRPDRGHWLTIQIEECAPIAPATGAWSSWYGKMAHRSNAGERRRSYLAANDPRVHFGLAAKRKWTAFECTGSPGLRVVEAERGGPHREVARRLRQPCRRGETLIGLRSALQRAGPSLANPDRSAAAVRGPFLSTSAAPVQILPCVRVVSHVRVGLRHKQHHVRRIRSCTWTSEATHRSPLCCGPCQKIFPSSSRAERRSG